MARSSQATLNLTEAATLLGVHYMTVYRYVRTGKLPAEKDGAEWRVSPTEVERLRRSASSERPKRGAADAGKIAAGLEARMLAGDNVGAWQLVESRLQLIQQHTAGIDSLRPGNG